MKLTVHTVAPIPARLADVSPLVFDRKSGSVYIGLSLGHRQHYRVYNLMQRQAALTSAAAQDAHGYYRPDGTFEWYEYFSVPSRADEREIRASIGALGLPVPPDAAREGSVRRLVVWARRRLRPLRVQVRRATERARGAKSLLRPPRPPAATTERIADLSRRDPDDSFITGNGYASRCRYVLNHDALSVNEEVDNDRWFCKSEWLEYFFRELAPDSPFVLVTANSDRAIDRRFDRYLRRPNLVAWLANNVAFEHPKLFAVPLGVEDPSLSRGRPAQALRVAQQASPPKTRLFEVSFEVRTNPEERLHCLAETRLELDPPLGVDDYMQRLASSHFCVAPAGNGIDTHRVWEALYLRTIPVVTRSVLTDQHPELPLVVLEDWSEFGSLDFSPELYSRTLGDWRAGELNLDRYLQRVSRRLVSRTAPEQPKEPPASAEHDPPG